MRLQRFRMRMRKGVALLLVMMISFAVLLAAAGIAIIAMPRATTVRTEAAADRALAVADATVDELVNQINKASLSTSSLSLWIDADGDGLATEAELATARESTAAAIVGDLLKRLNGGSSSGNGMYVLFTPTGRWYRIDSGTLANGWLYQLGDTEGTYVSTAGIPGIAPSDPAYADYATNNLWFEADCHVTYWYDVSQTGDPTRPDLWKVHVSAFSLSKPELKKNVLAEVSRGEIKGVLSSETTQQTAMVENWYRVDTNHPASYFSDYAGIYGMSVSFGSYEVTTGPIRSDGDLTMRGWAQDVVYASGRVNDGSKNSSFYSTRPSDYGSGRFGPAPAKNQAMTIYQGARSTPKYVYDSTQTVPAALWDNGKTALGGSNINARNPLDPIGGVQDKAVDTGTTSTYYINATNAQVEFSIVGGVGMMRWRNITAFYTSGSDYGGIKTAGGWTDWYPVPDEHNGGNGAIYVTGNAYVSGTFTGRVTLGAGNSVYLQGDIIYKNPPQTDTSIVLPPGATPDALGLLAYNNVAISPYTYHHKPVLQIDATMMAVYGWFGLDPSILSRYNDYGTNPMPIAYWNGSQAINRSNSTAPLVGSKGYAIQYTNFDSYLLTYGPAPFFPTTGSKVGTTNSLALVTDNPPTDGLMTILRTLPKDQKRSLYTTDPNYALAVLGHCVKYVDYGGVRYYCTQEVQVTGTVTNFTYTADVRTTDLYRVSWKEQIGDVVE